MKKLSCFVLICRLMAGSFAFAQSENFVQYVGNMGVLVSLEGTQILIDGLHLKYGDEYLNPPQPLLDSLIHRISPYQVDILLFTHVHKDHFHYQPAFDFLLKNPKTQLIAPQQVLDTLLKFSNGAPIASQLISAENAALSSWAGVRIQSYQLPHTWKSRHFRIANYAYVFQKNGQNVVHLGDASADEDDFKNPLFNQNEFGVAIVPAWFLGSSTTALTLRHLKARKLVVGHLNPSVKTPDIPENLSIPTEWMTHLGQKISY